MRIDALSEIGQIYQANGKMKKVGSTTAIKRDSVQISGFGRDLQVAKEAVAAESDIRTDKVNEIKTAMANGTYFVPMSAVADKLLQQSEDAMNM
ncbi:MAG: flagellar biosynthesis anti-sigma factor FlgM [Lachnospiraceae bacterium]|jgi:negative regulator of flagellin synthesis FlgM|nr:flagellar biosynthesis anti-sigma factor FlgM [Lachnospiraceae bacterium]